MLVSTIILETDVGITPGEIINTKNSSFTLDPEEFTITETISVRIYLLDHQAQPLLALVLR